MPELLISLVLAEKGGSRTLRGPYDPQTGFEDQRHHRAPSFSFRSNSSVNMSMNVGKDRGVEKIVVNTLRTLNFSVLRCLDIPKYPVIRRIDEGTE